MEADVRRGGRDGRHRRHKVLRRVRLRCVDGDVRGADRLEEGQRLGAVLVVQPGAMPELDEHLVVADLLTRPLEVLERVLLVHDVLRQLEENAAELARRPQRLERLEESPEDLSAQLPRRAVDATAVVDGHLVAKVFRQRLDLHQVSCHQPERLHVHREPVGRAIGPALHHGLARQPIERRVDLDRVEALGVVRQAFLRRELRRVEVLRQGLVGPGARPDADRRRHDSRLHQNRRESCGVARTTSSCGA